MTETRLFINLHKQPLTSNLHEKMEYLVLQFFEELQNRGLLAKIQEYYTILPYEAYLRNKLFDLLNVDIFNQIVNNYFNEEDKNELQRYYRPDPRHKRMTISEYRYKYIYLIAINFARQNKIYIKTILNSFDTLNPILK